MRTNERTNERTRRLALALTLCLVVAWGTACATSRSSEPGAGPEVLEFDLVYPPTVVGGYRRLDRFLPDDEAATIIDSFEWNATLEVPETGPTGLPTLYYVVVQVNDVAQTDLLERASVMWSPLPLFEAEQPALPDEPLVLAASGAHGSFVFALMSGAGYNVARQSALEGHALFDIISFREPPPDVVLHPDGSLDLEALVHHGFEWPAPYVAPSIDGELGTSREALSELLTDSYELFINASYEAYLAAAAWLSGIIRLLSPTATLRVGLVVSSPDADWVPAMSPMLRTWGNTRRITTQGQRTFALRDSGVGLYRSTNLITGGDFNSTAFTVPSGNSYRVCYESRIGTLRVIDAAVPTSVCTPPIAVPPGGGGGTVTLAEQDLQTVAVAFDALQYLQQFQVSIRPPVIAGGQLATAMVFGQNGIVFGHGGRDPATLALINATDAIVLLAASGADGIVAGNSISGNLILSRFGLPPVVPPLPPLGPAVLPWKSLYNVDIVWPPGNPSRLVIAHEIGHHIFYQLMVNAELSGRAPPGTFAATLLQIIFGTVLPGNPQGNPFFEAVAINEGIADFFASQLVGGGNRIASTTIGTYPGDGVGTGAGGVGEVYCSPTATPPFDTNCFEWNFTGEDGGNILNDQASRVSTLLVDLIDDFAVAPGSPVPQHGGIVWFPSVVCTNGELVCPVATPQGPLPGPTAGILVGVFGPGEEAVFVGADAVIGGLTAWMPTGSLTIDRFGAGLTTSLRAAGVTDFALCTAYGLHTPFSACPAAWLP